MVSPMSPAVASSLTIVAYLALFAGVGILFLFANLVVGYFVRPHNPHAEKLEVYECGEPTIGSSFVQFDLRFYVVALLFIIFDVEVAFFFPWAAVFGKANLMSDPAFQVAQVTPAGEAELTTQGRLLYEELGVRNPQVIDAAPASLATPQIARMSPAERADTIAHLGAKQLAWVTIVDILVFFAILLVGFAYVWKRGDLDWVRAVTEQRSQPGRSSEPSSETVEPSLSI
jgi:NADH-quinone oxidoreductase subunit A